MARELECHLPITHLDLAAPTNKAKPFNDPEWIWELKRDGYRALLIRDGERENLLPAAATIY